MTTTTTTTTTSNQTKPTTELCAVEQSTTPQRQAKFVFCFFPIQWTTLDGLVVAQQLQ
jgi:hypothetical protein